MPLFKCDWEHCSGHFSKFSSCLAEALWVMTMQDEADETTGSVEYEGFFALFTYGPDDPPSKVDINEDGEPFIVRPGHYILCEDSMGLVSLVEYHTEEEARESFMESDARYGRWLEANDNDPAGDSQAGADAADWYDPDA